jgi:uncharacterized membrane protein
MPQLALSAGIVIVVFLGLVGLAIVVQLWTNRIDLRYLLSEKNDVAGEVQTSRASLSRFQFLIFTLIIGMCILVVTLDSGEFPKLDSSILGLLGISGGSFLVSKSIQQVGRKQGE